MPLSKFEQKKDFSIKTGGAAQSHNIVTIPTPKSHIVDEFIPSALKDAKGVRYSDLQQNFITNNDSANSRFKLNDLVRGPLSVEREEEERIRGEIQSRLEVELTQFRDKVQQDAFQKGFEEGKKAAEAAVMDAIKPKIQLFDNFLLELDGMKNDLHKANEELITKMVYKLAKIVALKDIKEDPAYTSRLIVQLLERVGTRENIKVFVSAEVYSAAEKIKADLAQTLGTLKNITIDHDPEVKDAGCRIETDFGDVDARIEVQLENIVKAFETA